MTRWFIGLAACTTLLLTACSDSSDAPIAAAEPLLQRYVLSSEDSIPEGIAFDQRERAFYATSLQGGSITRIDADGTESIFRDADGLARLGGVKVDSQARRLWVCASGIDASSSEVWVFDLDSGALEMAFLLGAITTNGRCNDLALDNNGIAYVTDPAGPYIYRLDASTGEGEILATDPLFNDETGINLGLNGIAVTADGSALIVAKFFPGSLLQVSLPDAERIVNITLTGDEIPSADGLAILNGDIYVVSGNSVSRARPNADLSAASVVLVEQIAGLSTATIAEDALYVIKSEVTNFSLGRPLQLPLEFFAVDTSAYGP